MAHRHFSIHSLVRAQPPLTSEQLADWWTKRNVGAIAEIAMRSMLDPVGTAYDVLPVRIVVFKSSDARILYQLRLHDAANAQCAKPIVQHAIGQHIEDLVRFCHEQFLAALLKLDIQATFKRDEFAVRR